MILLTVCVADQLVIYFFISRPFQRETCERTREPRTNCPRGTTGTGRLLFLRQHHSGQTDLNFFETIIWCWWARVGSRWRWLWSSGDTPVQLFTHTRAFYAAATSNQSIELKQWLWDRPLPNCLPVRFYDCSGKPCDIFLISAQDDGNPLIMFLAHHVFSLVGGSSSCV